MPFCQSPLGIGLAPPAPRTRARRVDQHAIEPSCERCQPIRLVGADHLNIANAGALQTLEDRAQAMPVGIMGVDLALVRHHGGKRQGLAPCPGTDIGDLFAGLGTSQQGSDLRGLVLDFEPALAMRRLGFDGGIALLMTGRRDAHAPGRQFAGNGAEFFECSQQFRAIGLERVGPEIDRRPACKCGTLLRCAVAKGAYERRRQPFGKVAGNMRRQSNRQWSAERSAFGVGQFARAVGLGEMRCDAVDGPLPHIVKRCDCKGARRGLAHTCRQRIAMAQDVEDQSTDGVAIAGACETMRLGPILERLGCRPVMRFHFAKNFDRRGNAAAVTHDQPSA